ncbi:SusC/RagA family TonB-linked outer membrane protein [Bacteroidaceae bacterium HV4-6-C5C]|nr:SusC/RagA family TonB-linked outer membrane protein [Bacteroidaceae bacterium HV4-6-C5C]
MVKFLKKVSLLLLTCFSVGTTYAIAGNEIAGTNIAQQVGVCSGVVKDASGEPIIGASVRVKGTSNGSITDVDGKFSIQNAKRGDVIQVTFVGYQTQEVKFVGQPLSIILADDSQLLNEVVVTALGIKKDAKKLGYAVSTVNAVDLNKAAAPNLGSALYGKASGVRIQTAPGGAMGSISINVRGLSSITGTNQPLVVVDGVPIHNGDTNKDGYWGNQRIQSNGLADINPEDIENLSILKGASASALYGSEAANGVVMITTKSGKGASGYGVDFNASLTADMVAYMPEYQTKYGPGPRVGSRATNALYDSEGFRTWNVRGKTYQGVANTYSYWGPKYDGRDVIYYDGTVRKYSPITDDPWSDVFRTGFNQQYNLAITKGNDKGNMRFSYTYVDNLPTQYNSTYKKHNFNLTGNYNVTSDIKLGYGVTYLLQDIKNRPYRISRLTDNFGGFFGPFDDIKYLREHTKTSLGYKNQVYTSSSQLTPDEGFAYSVPCAALVDEYYWNIFGKEQFETENRLMANITPSWEIAKGLTLRGRVATDFTATKLENKEQVEQSIVFGNYGYYGLQNDRYEIFYGDVMLNYNLNLTDKLGLDATIGWQGRKEKYSQTGVSTSGGLSVENWFNLNASKGTKQAWMDDKSFLKTAAFGMLSLSYDDWAYLEGTARQEKISTLAPGNNSFFYPSVNGSIIYTSLFKDKLPDWYNYGKVRLSYGVVGNAPEIYAATKAYTQATAAGQWIYNTVKSDVGNDNIRPEKKYEWEFGLESKFFDNRLGFELSYYTNTVKDQILQTTMPASSGATSILMNVGELKNKGFELSLYGTPIATRDWTWSLRGNLAWNKNKVTKLADGIDRLEHSNYDNGSAYLYSNVGQPMGDIYAYVPEKNANGEYIVMDNGFYKLTDETVKVGNAMPKLVGGFATTLTYKDFSLDMSFDYRIGGAVLNTGWMYMMGQGAIKESLKYHDGEGYGATYYFNGSTIVPASTAPAGKTLHDNGIILPGVKADGTPNTTMISADQWANWTYNWGSGPNDAITYYGAGHGVFDNTYVKCRELAISYNVPKSVLSKFKCKNLQLSVFGRNLFYIYKNLPGFDAEATDGTTWITQAKMGGSTATTRSIGVSLRASF